LSANAMPMYYVMNEEAIDLMDLGEANGEGLAYLIEAI